MPTWSGLVTATCTGCHLALLAATLARESVHESAERTVMIRRMPTRLKWARTWPPREAGRRLAGVMTARAARQAPGFRGTARATTLVVGMVHGAPAAAASPGDIPAAALYHSEAIVNLVYCRYRLPLTPNRDRAPGKLRSEIYCAGLRHQLGSFNRSAGAHHC